MVAKKKGFILTQKHKNFLPIPVYMIGLLAACIKLDKCDRRNTNTVTGKCDQKSRKQGK